MKITRRQLRKLISESILSEMPMIKPGGDMDPEYLGKLTDMIAVGDKAAIKQADDLASMLGHDSESLSQDLSRYDQVGIMGHAGKFMHYLTQEEIKMLMNIKGKKLRYYLNSFYGFEFGIVTDINANSSKGIPADNMNDMVIRIAAKKKDITDDDYDSHEGMETGVQAAHDLTIAIMNLSDRTYVGYDYLEDAAIGQIKTPVAWQRHGSGEINFYEPGYEQLYKSGKLVITR